MLARAEGGSIGALDPAEVKCCFDQLKERYSINRLDLEIGPTIDVSTVAMPTETFQSIVASLIDDGKGIKEEYTYKNVELYFPQLISLDRVTHSLQI